MVIVANSADSSIQIDTDSEPDEPLSSGDCSTTTSDTGSSAQTILNSLKCPPSLLATRRKTRSNPPIGAKRRVVKAVYEPKSVSPITRVDQFPGKELTVSNGVLFCSACREPVSLKKSIVKLHRSTNYTKLRCLRKKLDKNP